MAQISKEYAEALFSLSCEYEKEKQTANALREIQKRFREYPDLFELLTAPSIPMEERLQVIEKVFGSIVPEHVLSFLQLLCERRRLGVLEECIKEYLCLLQAKEATTVAKVTSAVPLTPAELTTLKQKLEKISGNTVTTECHIDPSLLGGVIVELNGKVMDGSLRHRLREVKDVMNQ